MRKTIFGIIIWLSSLSIAHGQDWFGLVKAQAPTAVANDQYGYAVAASGQYAAIGAYLEDGTDVQDRGAVYLLAQGQGGSENWGLVKKITASDGAALDHFGQSVALSGDVLIVGAPDADADSVNQGAAYIFMRNQGGTDQWGQVKKLTITGGGTFDNFGWAVAASGDLVLVSAYGRRFTGNNFNQGTAYLFGRNQGGTNNWGLIRQLSASDGAEQDNFGFSAALSGDIAVLGAYGANISARADQGAAYIFARNQGGTDNWGQVKKLIAADGAANDWFGWSVAATAQQVLVGAYAATVGSNDDQGAAYIFARNQGGTDNWGQVKKLTAADGAASDWFGTSVALSDSVAVVGSGFADVGSNTDQGAAYLYSRSQGGADNWGQLKKLTASDGASGDSFGGALSISIPYLVTGAGLATDGTNPVGAAYIWKRIETATWIGTQWDNRNTAPTPLLHAVIAANYSQAATAINCRSFSIQTGQTFTLTNGSSLFVGGNFRNEGTFNDQNTGNLGVTFNGSAQTLQSKTTFRRLTLANSTSLTLADTAIVTLALDLSGGTVNTNGRLRLASSSPVAHAAIIGGTHASVNGNVRYDRYWSAQALTGYRYLSTPLRNTQTFGQLGSLSGVSLNNLIRYDEPTGYLNGWLSAGGTTGLVQQGRGYAWWLETNTMLSFVGQPQLESFTLSGLTKTDDSRPDAQEGWQLVGNPFPATLDWAAVSRTQIDNALYYWDRSFGGSGGYRAWVNGISNNGASPLVAPGQGFFVKVNTNGSGGTLTIPATARVATAGATMYRQHAATRLVLSDAHHYWETHLRHEPTATPAFDGEWDAWHLGGGGTNNELFTIQGPNRYAVNSQAAFESVPLGISVGSPGRLNLRLAHSPVHWWLEDRYTGIWHDLSQGAYAFEVEVGTWTDRLVLHPVKAQPLTDQTSTPAQLVVFRDPAGWAAVWQGQSTAQATLTDLSGRTLQSYTLLPGQTQRLSLPTKGLHLLHVVGPDGRSVYKLTE